MSAAHDLEKKIIEAITLARQWGEADAKAMEEFKAGNGFLACAYAKSAEELAVRMIQATKEIESLREELRLELTAIKTMEAAKASNMMN